MAAVNPLLPHAERALHVAQTESLPLNVPTLREIMDRNVHELYGAMDVSVALRRLQGQACERVLQAFGPAIKSAHGYEHVEPTEDEGTLERVLALREEMTRDLEASCKTVRDRLAMARLRREMAEGVPTAETVGK